MTLKMEKPVERSGFTSNMTRCIPKFTLVMIELLPSTRSSYGHSIGKGVKNGKTIDTAKIITQYTNFMASSSSRRVKSAFLPSRPAPERASGSVRSEHVSGIRFRIFTDTTSSSLSPLIRMWAFLHNMAETRFYMKDRFILSVSELLNIQWSTVLVGCSLVRSFSKHFGF